jgi:hypothetical protein
VVVVNVVMVEVVAVVVKLQASHRTGQSFFSSAPKIAESHSLEVLLAHSLGSAAPLQTGVVVVVVVPDVVVVVLDTVVVVVVVVIDTVVVVVVDTVVAVEVDTVVVTVVVAHAPIPRLAQVATQSLGNSSSFWQSHRYPGNGTLYFSWKPSANGTPHESSGSYWPWHAGLHVPQRTGQSFVYSSLVIARSQRSCAFRRLHFPGSKISLHVPRVVTVVSVVEVAEVVATQLLHSTGQASNILASVTQNLTGNTSHPVGSILPWHVPVVVVEMVVVMVLVMLVVVVVGVVVDTVEVVVEVSVVVEVVRPGPHRRYFAKVPSSANLTVPLAATPLYSCSRSH